MRPYIANKLEYPLAPLVLALVLGGPLENALRQSLKMSQTDPSIFFVRPISAVIMVMAIAIFLWPLLKRFIFGPSQPALSGSSGPAR